MSCLIRVFMSLAARVGIGILGRPLWCDLGLLVVVPWPCTFTVGNFHSCFTLLGGRSEDRRASLGPLHHTVGQCCPQRNSSAGCISFSSCKGVLIDPPCRKTKPPSGSEALMLHRGWVASCHFSQVRLWLGRTGNASCSMTLEGKLPLVGLPSVWADWALN